MKREGVSEARLRGKGPGTLEGGRGPGSLGRNLARSKKKLGRPEKEEERSGLKMPGRKLDRKAK